MSVASRVEHHASHRHLLRSTAAPFAGHSSSRTHLDAIIVPTSRPAAALENLIALSSVIGCSIVVLCSKRANVEQVMKRISQHPDARGVVVRISDGYELPDTPLLTTSDHFRSVNARRDSDLSLKRNFGLLLARRMGWRKVIFLDDDITVSPQAVGRLTNLLDEHPVAGMVSRHFPDNSVVCHARRLAGFAQDVFVSGSVLGVYTSDLPLAHFPNIYNEDWLFFSGYAAGRQLPKAGEVSQAEYFPFRHTERAAHEEFGDLIAEGLYAHFATQGPEEKMSAVLSRATEDYWEDFISIRRELIDVTASELESVDDGTHADIARARTSLQRADGRYSASHHPITAGVCAEYIDAWQQDAQIWGEFIQKINPVRTIGEALRSLNAPQWEIDRRLARLA